MMQMFLWKRILSWSTIILAGCISLLQTRANYKNQLLVAWEKMAGNNNQFATDYINITMRHFNTSDPNQRFTKNRAIDNIAPFLIAEGKLLCRRPIKQMLDIYGRAGDYKRLKTFVDMINVGLGLGLTNYSTTYSSLPILFMNGDGHACDVPTERETLNYPRLSWAVPAPRYNQDEWCDAIGVPTYQMWLDYKDETHSSWDNTFSKRAKEYPWSKKIHKAVWRGTTTSYSSYPRNKLSNIPRGQLVELSMEFPHLIDAAFVRFGPQWREREEELTNTTIVKEPIKFDGFMDYKAIIDIDGNNWSSRFPKLLCTNSVVIKVDPWYAEYFYNELKPWVHYIPATLDNLINVTSYVLDEDNEDEMQSIIRSANAWCQDQVTRQGMARDMMKQIQKYELALDDYMDEHAYSREMLMGKLHDLELDDLVECKSPMATKRGCHNGILSDGVCCAKSCGQCGGSGCSSFPGGESKCCAGTIRGSNVMCKDEFDTVCISSK